MGKAEAPPHSRLMATVMSNTPLRALEISRSGCLVESPYSIDAGTAGKLRLAIGGRIYSGEVRITRCRRVEGGGGYRLGVEFLRIGRPGASSLSRMLDQMVTGEVREGVEQIVE